MSRGKYNTFCSENTKLEYSTGFQLREGVNKKRRITFLFPSKIDFNVLRGMHVHIWFKSPNPVEIDIHLLLYNIVDLVSH